MNRAAETGSGKRKEQTGAAIAQLCGSQRFPGFLQVCMQAYMWGVGGGGGGGERGAGRHAEQHQSYMQRGANPTCIGGHSEGFEAWGDSIQEVGPWWEERVGL